MLPPCNHPLIVDEPSEEAARECGMPIDSVSLRRRCLLCGFYYYRTGVLEDLRVWIRGRHRLGRLPADVQADLNREEGL